MTPLISWTRWVAWSGHRTRFPQKEIADSSYAYQRAVENKEKVIVGVNEYSLERILPETLHIDEGMRGCKRSSRACAPESSNEAVGGSLDALRRAARAGAAGGDGDSPAANTMPYLLDCVRAYATVGEICAAMRKVLGTYKEVSIS